MTITSATNRASFAGDGTTNPWTFTFPIVTASDLLVIKRDAAGVETTFVLNTDYTVSAAPFTTGGAVTPLAATTVGATYSVIGNVPLTQPLALQDGGPLPAASANGAWDRITMIVRRLREQVGRSILLRETDSWGSGKLDAGANEIINVTPGTAQTSAATVSQVGSALPLASTADAQAGTEAAKVMTPATTLAEINQFRAFASNAEAQAGALTNKVLNPANLKSAAEYADFTPSGTGAVVRSLRVKMRDFVSVKDFNAKGDGSTDDTAAIQAALDAIKAAGGGTLYFPASSGAYKITSGLTYDMSAAASRFDKRFRIVGDGVAASVISLVGVAATALTITGSAANPETWLSIEGIRITGNNTVGSKGLVLSIAAFGSIERCAIEAFDYNLDCTDVEQTQFSNSNFRWGVHGVRFNAVGSTTSPNSLVFINCSIANNSQWGLQVTNGNAFSMVGGSIQYNGLTGGGSTYWGAKFIECGDGYGTVVFDGVALEGNGGVADVWTVNSTNTAAYAFRGCGFTRPNSTSYATSFLLIDGSTASKFAFAANTWRGYGSYTPSAGRPYITNNNASAQLFSDGSNVWGSATEYPTWAAFGLFASLVGTDVNSYISGPFSKTDGITVGSLNDALSGLKPIELRTTDLSVSGLTGVGSTNLKIYAGLQGTATYDPPSLADGVGTTTTVTVTGAALGDTAVASFSLDTQGITITAWVSSANTVSVRFQNESGGTLDIASGTLKATIIK